MPWLVDLKGFKCFINYDNHSQIIKLTVSTFMSQFIDVGTMVSPTVYARRSLSYLMSDMPQEAFNDASQAQLVSPIWHIASYLQAAALFALGKEDEAQAALRDASALETKRNATA